MELQSQFFFFLCGREEAEGAAHFLPIVVAFVTSSAREPFPQLKKKSYTS